MPFQSEAQRRKFYAMAARGEISRATVARWEAETVGRLPKKRGCGCKHVPKPSRKKKPCCASCAVGLPCEGGCKHKHHHHGHHHGPKPTKTKTVLNRKRLLRHLKEDSSVFHELLADDRGLIQQLQREERAMATKKTSKKKKTKSKKTTSKKKVVRRKKKVAPPMSRKTACIVLCREKYTKKAHKKK